MYNQKLVMPHMHKGIKGTWVTILHKITPNKQNK